MLQKSLTTTGGLFDHSLAVTETLLLYTEQLELEWDRLESPYLVGMFHDLCKTDDYVMLKQGWEYNKNKTLVGKAKRITKRVPGITPDTQKGYF